MAIFMLMPILCSSMVISLLIEKEHFFQSLSGNQWLPICLISSITMTLAITPTTLIAIACGYFIGWAAIPYVLPAYLIASAMGYGLGRVLDGGRIMKSLKQYPKANAFSQSLCRSQWQLMVMARLSPVLPFSFVNLLLPSLNIRFSVFLFAGFIGMLPRTLFSIWLGLQARDLFQLLQTPNQDWGTLSVPAILAIISTAGIIHLIQKSISKAVMGITDNSG